MRISARTGTGSAGVRRCSLRVCLERGGLILTRGRWRRLKRQKLHRRHVEGAQRGEDRTVWEEPGTASREGRTGGTEKCGLGFDR